MSYNCDIHINVVEIRFDLREKFFNVLSNFRPSNLGSNVNGSIKEFPSNFSDDPTGAIDDFAKEHKLSFSMTCYFPEEDNGDEPITMVYKDGILISEEGDEYE